MHISNEAHDTQQAGSQWMKFISVRWIASSICVLSIFLIILFANYHQSISAGSRILLEPEPILHRDNGQVLDIEKMARNTDQLAARPSIWPTSGEVTSGFGWRNSPMGGGGELHPGIDIANSMGAPVVAAADGVVVQSGAAGGYGNMVQIDHGNGISTIYGHNSRIIVSMGQSVRKGQVVSYVGSTGKSTGPHLHYEVRINGNAVDPIGFMVQ